MIGRRGFLSSLIAGTAALALDPERLLWVPGQKTIFVPPLRHITFDLNEMRGQFLVSKIPGEFYFAEAIDFMDAAFCKRVYDLLNQDLLGVPYSQPKGLMS